MDTLEVGREPGGKVSVAWGRKMVPECWPWRHREGTIRELPKRQTGCNLVTDQAVRPEAARITGRTQGSGTQQVSSWAADRWCGHPRGGRAQKEPQTGLGQLMDQFSSPPMLPLTSRGDLMCSQPAGHLLLLHPRQLQEELPSPPRTLQLYTSCS